MDVQIHQNMSNNFQNGQLFLRPVEINFLFSNIVCVHFEDVRYFEHA